MAKKILLVDDDNDTINIVCDVLVKEGYEVETAANGLEALEKISSDNRPDLIILDIMMPKLDGISLSLKLKASPLAASIPIIVITAYGQSDDVLSSRSEIQVSAYMKKPLAMPELLDKVKELI
jgi:CheY-like chemotaxis protein